ncbi:MAG: TetR/AcrR family transcriptional regulator [Nitriliruptoraceae bacterium]|nr:TetR/AcrR family transcriptional regulator [Nitriliruptoraceae bacterium]
MSGRRSRAEQQAQTRARLLVAARDVIVEHGLEGAAIDAITSRAGFSRGAFYSNFRDKTDLLVQLGDAEIARFTAEVLPGFLAMDPEEQLAAVAAWLTQRQTPTEILLLIELSRSRERDASTGAAVDAVIARIVDGVEELMTAPGSVLAGLDAAERRVRARALLAAILGADLMGHLGLPLDERAVTWLLAGAVGPASTGQVTA